jgi:hypothetical protein
VAGGWAQRKEEYGGCVLYPYLKIRRRKPVEIVLRSGGEGKGEGKSN